MKIDKKPINFTDERGTIRDIFVNEPKQHCTIITTNKGGVRANHYHKVSKQHDFIVSGRMKIYWQEKPGESEILEGELIPGDLVEWEPGEVHEFIALEDNTVFLTFVDGVRGGDDYEKDTYRIDIPLHVQKEGK